MTTELPVSVPEPSPFAQLWTVTDIASYGQIKVGTVRNWASAGRLPKPVRLGRAVRWRACEVVAYFAQDGE
ncbi:DNA-binding protein [Cryobacterium sp. Hz7]|uniref:helix-turn-helix transcriptional regulator n=1 Tax=Cryobacterium sp. Hz7 TaxID=1259166 RepID=UPI00106DBE6C|nr:helix-turn-helix domain-containing protein [Cryobacterium sp. Hz7]TFB62021.1 DNA-binding protein [Cryobacterium sp. Hz7]